MALIPLYYVIADSYDVDPLTNDIKEGMCVAFNGASGIRRVTAPDVGMVVGLSGDTKSTSASSMPGIGDGWQNRVSDGYNETKASGKLTVYHSGGVFATDQYAAGGSMIAANVGHYLQANANGVLAYLGAAKTGAEVAQLVQAPGPYPSGVPGTDINQDSALGGDNTNTYIVVKLLV